MRVYRGFDGEVCVYREYDGVSVCIQRKKIKNTKKKKYRGYDGEVCVYREYDGVSVCIQSI